MAPNAGPGAAQGGFRVAVEDRTALQSLLDQHGSLILESNADYRSLALPTLTVSSGQRIVGGANTRVPRLLILGGTSDVFIALVRHDAPASPDIIFTGSGPIEDIEIIGGSGGPTTNILVQIDAGVRINRLSLAEFGGLDIRQGSGGYVRNSVFTRLIGYWPGPHIRWHGNLMEPSGGNVLLGFASITPEFSSVWRDVGDLCLVGWDCETWNMHGTGSGHAFELTGATRLVSVGFSGGSSLPDLAGALGSFQNIENLVSWFAHGSGGARDGADVVCRDVKNAVFLQGSGAMACTDARLPPDAARVRILDPNGASQPAAASRQAPSHPSAVDLDRVLAATLLGEGLKELPGARRRVRPQQRILGPGSACAVAKGLATYPHASEAIQAEIDRHGIARLACGIYLLERPLKIGSALRPEGLLGPGRVNAVLVAQGDFPLFEGRGDFGSPLQRGGPAARLHLSGFTLSGGSHGLSFTDSPGNLGGAGLIAWSTFTDLNFLGQRVAGISAEHIFGFDSNFWYQVDFSGVPVAFRGLGSGSGERMTYADKQHFLDCQFVDIDDAVWFWTADRASGGQLWTNSLFKRVGAVSKTRSGNNLLWSNCLFEDVAGPTAIQTLDDGKTSTYYFYQVGCLWRGRGPAVVTSSLAGGMGVLFIDTEFAQNGGYLVVNSGRQALSAWNSTISGTARPGAIRDGIFIGSSLGVEFRQVETRERDGSRIWIDRPASPGRPMLGC